MTVKITPEVQVRLLVFSRIGGCGSSTLATSMLPRMIEIPWSFARSAAECGVFFVAFSDLDVVSTGTIVPSRAASDCDATG